jgi:antitoxin (DNA-binding transcriptional repressor) of toxin-antitoxin stability system
MRPRQLLVWGLLAAGIVVAAVVGSQRTDEGLPLDPTSPGPAGTKALVDTLRDLGVGVSVSTELPSGAGAALLLADDLTEDRRAELLDWVNDGGTLVVADPSSPVTQIEPAGNTRIGLVEAELEPRCALPATRDVGRVSAPGAVVFRVPPGAQGCFQRDGGSWLVAFPTGAGTLVRLGGASALLNREIGKADNAVLMVDLLAPEPGAGAAVTVLRPPGPGGGSKGLGALIAPRVKLALLQLLIAFLLLALWRSRRLGRPLTEPTAVRIRGSELVVAVGNLLQRARHRRQAAALLSGDLRRTLAERLGLPASAPARQVAETASARTGIQQERVLAALEPSMPRDEAELVALGQEIDTIRTEVVSAHGAG